MVKNGKVLFVDDDKIDRMAFERFTKTGIFDFDYVVASSYSEAEAYLNNDTYDAIISDYQLGDGTAFDLLKIAGDTPLIFVTGLGDQETAVRAMKEGAYDYVIKDGNGRHLKTLPITIDNAIKRRNAEIELHNYREHLEDLVARRTNELLLEIEERRSAQEKLKESEEKFRGLAERSSDIIMLIDKNNLITYVAPSVCKILGFIPEELYGYNINTLLSEREYNKILQKIESLIEGENVESLELLMNRHDKTQASIECTFTKIIEENEVKGVQLIGWDITDKKLAEEALKKSEELFRTVIDSSKDAMISINDKGLITIFNPSAEEMFQYDKESLVGKELDILMPEIYRKVHKANIVSYMTTGKPDGAINRTVELSALRSDGLVFPIDLTLSTGYLSEEKFVLAVIRDITERKKQENAIKHRLKFEKLISVISSRFVGGGNINEDIDKTLEEICKFTNSEKAFIYIFDEKKTIIGNTHEWRSDGIVSQNNIFHNLALDKFPVWKNLISNSESLVVEDAALLPDELIAEREILLNNGVNSLILYNLKINNNDGGFIGFDNIAKKENYIEDSLSILKTTSEIIGNAIDRAMAEIEIKTLNANLEEKVKERTAQLNDAIEEIRYENEERKRTQSELEKLNLDLSESQITIEEEAKRLIVLNEKLRQSESQLKELNASKDKFFSILAHDLKGPFSGFLGLSELIAQEYDNLDKSAIAEMALSLNKGAKQLFNLLENLLEWSRIQRGSITITPSNIRLNAAAASNIELIAHNAEKKNIIIINKIDAYKKVYADQNMLNTIFRNLISNAVKFTNHDGVIRLSAENYESDEKFVQVNVADNGIGMDEATIEKLFRIDVKHSTFGTDNERGTGLGLLLCRELVEKHGGKIWVESKPGHGSKFKFTIPKGE